MTRSAATRFDGLTYEAAHDADRLGAQLDRVRQLMRDNAWRTLAEIVVTVGGSEAGISARLRDLRKQKFGGYQVERQRVRASGLYEYRVLPSLRLQGELFSAGAGARSW